MDDDLDFAGDYRAAREQFRNAAQAAGARIATHPLATLGPAGEALAVDVATLGDDDAPAVLLITSGLHGVEGAVGSAVQSAWLRRQQGTMPPACLRVVLVHALKPWGFAHGRRTDELNVDLNRNFVLAGEPYAGAPEELSALAALVAPRSPPRLDLFPLRALILLATRGLPALRRLLTGGQHEYPQGLFFGGFAPSPANLGVQAHCATWLGGATRVLHLDLHSGLGRYGGALMLALCEPGSVEHEWLRRTFSRVSIEVEGGAAQLGSGWRGTFGRWLVLTHGAGRERCLHVTLEFGTLGPIAVFSALRNENRAWWQSPVRLPGTRARLAEAFAPTPAAWRQGVLRLGTTQLERAVRAWSASPPVSAHIGG